MKNARLFITILLGLITLFFIGCKPSETITQPVATTTTVTAIQPFLYDKYGYHGTVQAKGYLKIIYSSGACDESTGYDCGIYNYAMFHVDETYNIDLLNFIYSYAGSKFVDKNQRLIGLGCVRPKKEIYYFNSSKNIYDQPDGYIRGEDFIKLENSSAKNPVILQMTKSIETQEGGNNDCYSFFRDFKVVDTFDERYGQKQ